MKHINAKPDTFRFRGSLYGLILGDIIGSYFEFSKPHKRYYPDLNALKQGKNVFKVSFGYTDDTILSLHSMEAFIESYGIYRPLMHVTAWNQYLIGSSPWSEPGDCFDIGNSTRKSIIDPNWEGKKSPSNSGNGVLMKILPFVWAFTSRTGSPTLSASQVDQFDSVTNMTHGSDETIACTRAMAKVMTALLYGAPWKKAREVIKDEFPTKRSLQKKSYTGFCTETLELAIYLMDNYFDWQQGISAILSLGGDTDTNAAVFGQLYGATYPNEMHGHYFPHKADIFKSKEIDWLMQQFLDQFNSEEVVNHWTSRSSNHDKQTDDELRQDGQTYALSCPRDCVHHGEGCLLGYPVGPLEHFRRMNSGYRRRIEAVRSDIFRSKWTQRLGTCAPDGAPPCYHNEASSRECFGKNCVYIEMRKGP